jgi:hypothetical protein
MRIRLAFPAALCALLVSVPLAHGAGGPKAGAAPLAALDNEVTGTYVVTSTGLVATITNSGSQTFYYNAGRLSDGRPVNGATFDGVQCTSSIPPGYSFDCGPYQFAPGQTATLAVSVSGLQGLRLGAAVVNPTLELAMSADRATYCCRSTIAQRMTTAPPPPPPPVVPSHYLYDKTGSIVGMEKQALRADKAGRFGPAGKGAHKAGGMAGMCAMELKDFLSTGTGAHAKDMLVDVGAPAISQLGNDASWFSAAAAADRLAEKAIGKRMKQAAVRQLTIAIVDLEKIEALIAQDEKHQVDHHWDPDFTQGPTGTAIFFGGGDDVVVELYLWIGQEETDEGPAEVLTPGQPGATTTCDPLALHGHLVHCKVTLKPGQALVIQVGPALAPTAPVVGGFVGADGSVSPYFGTSLGTG